MKKESLQIWLPAAVHKDICDISKAAGVSHSSAINVLLVLYLRSLQLPTVGISRGSSTVGASSEQKPSV